MEYIKLNNGVEMPKVGLGTFLIPKENLEKTLIKAYELGYRQFDTAWRYHNEADIARIFKANGIKREDVFITTKINIDALYKGGYKFGWRRLLNKKGLSIEQAIQESFDNLETDYIDLFLIHHPWPMFMEMWKGLTKFYKEGKIRAIGVSSFLPPHIEALREVSDVVPAVNQFEISPLNANKDLIRYCLENGIAVEAMSTFSHFRSVEPRMEIIAHPVIIKIAEKYGKSTVQVVLRWMNQQGIIIIPKTWDLNHLAENINIFDFVLSDEDMATIDSLDQGRFLNYSPYIAQAGLPQKYKKWDGFKDIKRYPDWYVNRSLFGRWISNHIN